MQENISDKDGKLAAAWFIYWKDAGLQKLVCMYANEAALWRDVCLGGVTSSSKMINICEVQRELRI